MAGSADDITARKAAELQISRYARDLEYKNKELDEFAYIASHDLKAPLRAIENLSSCLEEDLEDKLTDRDRKYLGLLRNRVWRMDKLLDDLLEYSRVGRATDDRHQEIISGDTLFVMFLRCLVRRPHLRLKSPPNSLRSGWLECRFSRSFII
jgi:signal transduction histidine kinase